MAAIAASAFVRTRVQPPRLPLSSAALAPRNGLLVSTLLHTAILATLVSLPILLPPQAMNMAPTAAELLREYDYQPLILPVLPVIAESNSGTEVKHEPGEKAHNIAVTVPSVQASHRPKPDYAGAQLIVSNLPHSTKGVQSIRRPDLVTPPTLKYPLRLPSLVMLPVPAIPAPVVARQPQPVRPIPKERSTVRANAPQMQVPALTVEIPKLSVVPAEPVMPKAVPASEDRSPAFFATSHPLVSAPKPVVVLNAVSVPPEPVLAIPDAELATRFIVGPSTDVKAPETASGAAGRNIAGTGASHQVENLPHPSVENGTGTKVLAGEGHAGTVSAESESPRSESGTGAAAAPAAGNKGLPGISISGGVPGRSGRAAAINPVPHGSYGLTIISGGSSGGASRDLGVFSRNDTVYTVYIPMTDAGGGPDWPMQYALMNSAPARIGLLNGLVTPPVVLKKVVATAPKADLAGNSGLVFVTGVIDDRGKLQALRAMRALDARVRAAIDALAQWEFLPAELDGKPVASKVLIGVSVMPAEEVGKQN